VGVATLVASEEEVDEGVTVGVETAALLVGGVGPLEGWSTTFATIPPATTMRITPVTRAAVAKRLVPDLIPSA